MPFYAVARGRSVGIYSTWAECEAQVKGFSGARYKKFDSPENAQDFINREGGGTSVVKKMPQYSRSKPKQQSNNTKNLKRNINSISLVKSNHKSRENDVSDSSSSGDSEFSDSDSDYNQQLVDVVTKEMDKIEKKLTNFSKGIDKIMKKGSSKSGSERRAILIEPPKPKKRRSNSNNNSFDVDTDGYVQVYTDGACSANGRQGAKAGLGVYWGDGHPLNRSEPVSGRATNNCGEIQAATLAIKQAIENGITKLAINTDSQFLINSVTKWMPGWKRKGWKLQSGEPVKNEIDFKELDSVQNKLQIKWNYVEAHRGVHGNEMADQLAKSGAAMFKSK